MCPDRWAHTWFKYLKTDTTELGLAFAASCNMRSIMYVIQPQRLVQPSGIRSSIGVPQDWYNSRRGKHKCPTVDSLHRIYNVNNTLCIVLVIQTRQLPWVPQNGWYHQMFALQKVGQLSPHRTCQNCEMEHKFQLFCYANVELLGMNCHNYRPWNLECTFQKLDHCARPSVTNTTGTNNWHVNRATITSCVHCYCLIPLPKLQACSKQNTHCLEQMNLIVPALTLESPPRAQTWAFAKSLWMQSRTPMPSTIGQSLKEAERNRGRQTVTCYTQGIRLVGIPRPDRWAPTRLKLRRINTAEFGLAFATSCRMCSIVHVAHP